MARVDQPGALVNNASVASLDQIDPNPINNSDAESINAAPAADLRVTKAVSNAAPGVGALVTYTIAVTNLGPDDATSADVSDLLPAGVAFVSAKASQGSYDAGTGIWTLGAVPATRTEILTVTGRVTGLGTLVNTATRQSSTPVDPNAANDTGTATLTSSVVADLSLTKTPSVPVAAAGTCIHVDRRRRQQWPQHCVGSFGRRHVPGAVHRRDVDVHAQQRIEMHVTVGHRADRHDGRPPRRRERDVRRDRSQRARQ